MCGRFVRYAGDFVDCRLGLRVSSMDWPDLPVDEELPRSLHQRGQGAVGIMSEELLSGQRSLSQAAGSR